MQSSRSTSRTRRMGALAAPALIGAFVLASCGGAESDSSQPVIDLDSASTAFVVRPPVTVEPTDAEIAVDEAGLVEGTQTYVIQAGDYWFLLVQNFGVSLDDLLAVNDWTDVNDFPAIGTEIRIPPGARPLSEADTESEQETAGEGDTGTEDAAPGDTIPDAGDNCAEGTYTIAAGDYPLVVAEKFDVTVDALNQANAGTSGYDSFFVGLEIVIPAKTDC